MVAKFGFKAIMALLATLMVMPAMALDTATVERWADSMEGLQEWAEREGIEDRPGAEVDEPMDFDFERMMAESAREHPGAERVIRDAGFDSIDEWARVGGRIFNAWIAEEMAAESDDMDAEMAEALREIEENPHMSEEQKQMMRQQIEQMHGMQADLADAPEADRRAVRQSRARLERIMDTPED